MSVVETKPVDISALLARHGDADRSALIPLLQKIQEELGYLSRDAIVAIGAQLGLPVSKIYGVATFYNQFRFTPQGQYHVQICRGTACHVKGSFNVMETLQQELKILPGQTTKDGLFSLEIVACIGACGLAPVIKVNETFYAGITPKKVAKILNTYRKEAEAHV